MEYGAHTSKILKQNKQSNLPNGAACTVAISVTWHLFPIDLYQCSWPWSNGKKRTGLRTGSSDTRDPPLAETVS